MANPNAIPPRSHLADLKRQIAFNETMCDRVDENAAKKKAAYRAKNERIQKEVDELEALESLVNQNQ